MKIIELKAEAIQRLRAIDITPGDEPLVEITGKNEAGKSSVLDSILMAMGGKSATSLTPIHQGKEKGKIILDLGKYKVIKTITKKGEYVRVESADGASYKSAQSLIDSWKNDFTFDPLKFADADPKLQRAMLLKAVDLKVDPARIQEVTGVVVRVFPENPLAAIDEANKILYGQRTDLGREYDRAKKASEEMQIPEGMADVQKVNAQEIIQLKEGLQAKEKANQVERAKLEDIRRAAVELQNSIKNMQSQVAEVEEQIEKLHEKVHSLYAIIARNTTGFEAARTAYNDQKAIVDALVDPDMAEVDQKIMDAERINQVVYQRERKADLILQAVALGEKREAITDKMTELSRYRESLLAEAKLPIAGLGISEDGVVTFEGVPISQRGKSKRILLGLAICAALNPQVRVILVHSGNDLDEENMGVVYEWAKANDFQVWIERIEKGKGKGVAFEIVEGEVHG